MYPNFTLRLVLPVVGSFSSFTQIGPEMKPSIVLYPNGSNPVDVIPSIAVTTLSVALFEVDENTPPVKSPYMAGIPPTLAEICSVPKVGNPPPPITRCPSMNVPLPSARVPRTEIPCGVLKIAELVLSSKPVPR